MRSPLHHSMHRPALTIVTGLVLGGLAGGFLRSEGVRGPERQSSQLAQADRCVGGDEVSAFVCRNTWLANTKHSAARH